MAKKAVVKIGTVAMVSELAEARGITKREAEATLETVLAMVESHLRCGNVVALAGIGTLTPVTRRMRTGRNPKTGEAMIIPEKRGVRFKLSPKLFS